MLKFTEELKKWTTLGIVAALLAPMAYAPLMERAAEGTETERSAVVLCLVGASFSCNVSCVLLSTIFYVHLAFVPAQEKITKYGKKVMGVTEFVEGMSFWNLHSPDMFLVFGIIFLLCSVVIHVHELRPEEDKWILGAFGLFSGPSFTYVVYVYVTMFRDSVLDKDKRDFKELGESLVQKAQDLAASTVRSSAPSTTIQMLFSKATAHAPPPTAISFETPAANLNKRKAKPKRLSELRTVEETE